ncbi:hypothetical protein ABPG72_001201 [Tetrahymena utriculariae]
MDYSNNNNNPSPLFQSCANKNLIGKKKGLSFADLTKKINQNLKVPIQQIKIMATKMTQVSKVMKSSKGRDKICQIIQYSSDLTHACYQHSNIENIQKQYLEGLLKGPKVANNVKHSIKNGRKIFKLFNFLLEFKRIQMVIEKRKPILYKIALILCRITNFFYYLFDNILWATKIGKFSNLITHSPKTIKLLKDLFCFAKTIIKIIISVYKCQKRKQKIRTILQKTAGKSTVIIEPNEKYFYMSKYLLNQRIKFREDRFKILVKILQFFMLCKRLRIYLVNDHLGDIAYASFGLLATIINTLKNISEKQKLVKIQQTQDNNSNIQKVKNKIFA